MCDADNAKPATSSCNEHPYGCGDAPHPLPDTAAGFAGFLRTVPIRFTRAEIQALRDKALSASIQAHDSLQETAEESLLLQLAETLDLLDAVMVRAKRSEATRRMEKQKRQQQGCVRCDAGHTPCPNCSGCPNCTP